MSEKDDKKEKGSPLGELIAKSFFDKRIVSLYGEVSNDSAAQVCDSLVYLDTLKPNSDIVLFLNSPGGSVTDGMDIYDTMQSITSDVITVGRGMCASMGQFLLASGAKGKRYLFPHARVMMHQPSGGIYGNVTDIRIEADLIKKMRNELSKLTAEQTGKTIDEINKDNEFDHWFTAQEAVDYGFADHIIKSLKDLNIYTNDKKEGK